MQGIARDHPVLCAALAAGDGITKSVAIQLARWTKAIPGDCRDKAEELLAGAAQAGVGLRDLAALCAEIRARIAGPDPDGKDPGLDRGLSLAATIDGAGVLHGDLTPGAPRWSGRSWTPWPPPGAPATAGPAASATTTPCKKRCAVCDFASWWITQRQT